MVDDLDHARMLRAVEAAARVRGTTSPNPWVGCVIVTAAGEEFEGATHPPGGPHAEAAALAAAAGADLHGATAYVTLEPCSHHGRTPPCADALVAAGVARVVVGLADPDPDPQVAGRGLARLRDAGVEVEVAAGVRGTTSPNPWVGCVIVTAAGEEFEGATHPPGGLHAEAAAPVIQRLEPSAAAVRPSRLAASLSTT